MTETIFWAELSGFAKFSLTLPRHTMLKAPIGVRRDDNEHKGVTVRFGFDAIRTSQTLLTVQNKATGTSHEMSCIWLDWLCGIAAWLHERIIYAASAWGFQRCSFL